MPSGYKGAAQYTLLTSYYSDESKYLIVSSDYLKYPYATDFKSYKEYARNSRDNNVRFASSTYQTGWKDKYSVSEVTDSMINDIGYSYFSIINYEKDIWAIVYVFEKDNYFLTFQFRAIGQMPDENIINEIISSIVYST